MLKIFRFQCMYCQEIFEELVEGVEGMPEECLRCGEDLDFKNFTSFLLKEPLESLSRRIKNIRYSSWLMKSASI